MKRIGMPSHCEPVTGDTPRANPTPSAQDSRKRRPRCLFNPGDVTQR
jgi:hypothetical protein